MSVGSLWRTTGSWFVYPTTVTVSSPSTHQPTHQPNHHLDHYVELRHLFLHLPEGEQKKRSSNNKGEEPFVPVCCSCLAFGQTEIRSNFICFFLLLLLLLSSEFRPLAIWSKNEISKGHRPWTDYPCPIKKERNKNLKKKESNQDEPGSFVWWSFNPIWREWPLFTHTHTHIHACV